jgi:hypothetical protein
MSPSLFPVHVNHAVFNSLGYSRSNSVELTVWMFWLSM